MLFMPHGNIPVKHEYTAGNFASVLLWAHNQCMENLKRIRRSQGLSQIELAEKAGVSQGLISRMERGDANPTLDVIEAVAAALNVPPPLLFGLPEFQLEAILALSRMDDLTQASALLVLKKMAAN